MFSEENCFDNDDLDLDLPGSWIGGRFAKLYRLRFIFDRQSHPGADQPFLCSGSGFVCGLFPQYYGGLAGTPFRGFEWPFLGAGRKGDWRADCCLVIAADHPTHADPALRFDGALRCDRQRDRYTRADDPPEPLPGGRPGGHYGHDRLDRRAADGDGLSIRAWRSHSLHFVGIFYRRDGHLDGDPGERRPVWVRRNQAWAGAAAGDIDRFFIVLQYFAPPKESLPASRDSNGRHGFSCSGHLAADTLIAETNPPLSMLSSASVE